MREDHAYYRRLADSMPKAQRDILIAHVNGEHPIHVAGELGTHKAARAYMRAKGLIRSDRAGFPTKTLITDEGRAVLAAILGDYADALYRAGYTGWPPLAADGQQATG